MWVLIAIIIILLIFTIISARSSLVRLRLLSEKSERRVERKPKVKAEMPRPKPMEKPPQQALPRMELPINGLPTPLRGLGVVVNLSTLALIRTYHSPGGLMTHCPSQ
ncbi:hypothetical protein [Vulcanisaeta souniana]|uniref:hypothetical protein n=1 Tax=Vulcanisaeta souniana TaxID=164452 RepID=UPI0006D2519B|nr:hypothetical protein [Vulcanisaeta souniana]